MDRLEILLKKVATLREEVSLLREEHGFLRTSIDPQHKEIASLQVRMILQSTSFQDVANTKL